MTRQEFEKLTNEELAESLYGILKENGISVRELAKTIGWSPATISRAVNDSDYSMSYELAHLIKEALMGYFEDEQEKPKKRKFVITITIEEV